MIAGEPPLTVAGLLALQEIQATVHGTGTDNLDQEITGARLLTDTTIPDGTEPGTLLVDVASLGRDLDSWHTVIEAITASEGAHVVATWPPALPEGFVPSRVAGNHTVLLMASTVEPTTVIAAAAPSTRSAETGVAQRLTSLQRRLTHELSALEPLRALTERLARTCNATVVLVREDGGVEASSGPLPLNLLLGELDDDHGDTRPFSTGGWHGLGVRISTEEQPAGWLVAASRRDSFPDSFAFAAAHVAASLVETNMRIDLLARRQDRAVRSALLEQLLMVRFERHDPELAGRLAAVGISLDDEVRVLSAELLPGRARSDRSAALETLYTQLDQEFAASGAAHLLAIRDNTVVGLVQGTAALLQRTFVKATAGRPGFLMGIGRRVVTVGDVVGSYNDAELALRTLRSPDQAATVMAYEDFDFALRLFSDVGLDRMAAWASELLAPIMNQQILLEGLELYFEHDLNIIAAAKALRIHHNSLRYRLSRVEEHLGLNLRNPATVSSLFLALTARSMQAPQSRQRPDPDPPRPSGTALPAEAPGEDLSERQSGLVGRHLGVAIGPER